MPLRKLLLTGLLFILSFAIHAQSDDACLELVNQALDSVSAQCIGAGENTLCNAHPTVTVVGTNIDHNQVLPITEIQSVQSTASDIINHSWGISVLNIQSQTPNQTLWIVLLGDSSIEKQGDNFQNIRLRTGFDSLKCADAPNLVAIYATGDTSLELTIKDTQIRLQGIATFQFQNLNNLIVTQLIGSMDISDGATIQAGESIVAVTDNEGSVLFWSSTRPATSEEGQHGQLALDVLNSIIGESLIFETGCLEKIIHTVAQGENLYRIALHYGTTIDEIATLNNIPNPDQISAGMVLEIPCNPDAPSVVGAGCGSQTVHVVTRGETAFQIAQQYGTTVNAIAAASDRTDINLIHAGNILLIPCENDESAPIAHSDTNPLPNPDTNSVQQLCASLQASLSQTNASQQLIDFYHQTCGG
jgi:LysM repeat protein